MKVIYTRTKTMFLHQNEFSLVGSKYVDFQLPFSPTGLAQITQHTNLETESDGYWLRMFLRAGTVGNDCTVAHGAGSSLFPPKCTLSLGLGNRKPPWAKHLLT
jgi:hypothetical protein